MLKEALGVWWLVTVWVVLALLGEFSPRYLAAPVRNQAANVTTKACLTMKDKL